MSESSLVFLGLGGHVVAFDTTTGTEVWRCRLTYGNLVTIHYDGRILLAGSREVWRIDPRHGRGSPAQPAPSARHGAVLFMNSAGATVAAVQAQAAAAAAGT
jgi:hypothetical protein